MARRHWQEVRVTRWLRALVLVVPLGLAASAQAPAPAPARGSAASTVAATPQSVGIAPARLERLHHGMQALVDRHEAGGIVTLIAR